MVLGEFSAGKSTFLNALVGAEVSPMGVLPTTAHVHWLRHGAPGARVIDRRGDVVETSVEDCARAVARRRDAGREIDRVEVSLPLPFLARLELIDGELIPKAAPTFEHGQAQVATIIAVGGPFARKPGGPDGPGGWWFGSEVDVFERIDHPVMLDLAVTGAQRIYPRTLPDLARGEELVVAARLPKDGDLVVATPCGDTISARTTSACGTFDLSNAIAFGPENVVFPTAPRAGTYHICAIPRTPIVAAPEVESARVSIFRTGMPTLTLPLVMGANDRGDRNGVLGAIVFMTGGAFTDRATDFRASIANPFLDKPLDRAAVRRLVEARAAARSSAA